jgi:hypothetical protein
MTENGTEGKSDVNPQGSNEEGQIQSGQERATPEGVDRGMHDNGTEDARILGNPCSEAQEKILSLIPKESLKEGKLALIELAEKEGQRSLQATEASLDLDFKRFRLETETTEKSADSDRWTLRVAAAIEFAKWAVPACFALVLAWWMVSFYRSGNNDAARSIRELLLLMIGGALGWIARRSDTGSSDSGNGETSN